MIILASGGMDSLALVARLQANSPEPNNSLLFFNYGQTTVLREQQSVKSWAKHYSMPMHTIDITNAVHIHPSHRKDPRMVIPHRNLVMLSVAASWSSTQPGRQQVIVHGANNEDYRDYPDCREQFFESLNATLSASVDTQLIRVEAPFLFLDKRQIIEKGLLYNAPFELSWSCYNSNTVACQTCQSCTERAIAFDLLNKTDPLVESLL